MTVETRFHYRASDDTTIIERVQDVESILEANKREAAAKAQGAKRAKDMRKVASIPLIVVEQWLKQGVDVFNPEHTVKVKRMLQDPEYRYLRTDSSILHGKLPSSLRGSLSGGVTQSGLMV